MDFKISSLPLEPFAELFAMDDTALRARGAKRCIADAKPGYPCRVSLEDADIGEPLILTPYRHLSADSPYQASGPVFVRAGASPAIVGANEVPAQLRSRLLSVRAYDDASLMVVADVVDGHDLETAIDRLLGTPDVSFLHVHFARPGCYAARVDRA